MGLIESLLPNWEDKTILGNIELNGIDMWSFCKITILTYKR